MMGTARTMGVRARRWTAGAMGGSRRTLCFTDRFTQRCRASRCSLYFAQNGLYAPKRLALHHGLYSVTYREHRPRVCASGNPNGHDENTFAFRPDSVIRQGRTRLVSHLRISHTFSGGCGPTVAAASATWDGTATRVGS